METAPQDPDRKAVAPQPLRIAHLVNAFSPPKGSEWEWVLPITWETMRRAQAAAPQHLEVELLSAQFEDEHDAIPMGFASTTPLDRSVRDLYSDQQLPRLPLIADLLQRLHQATDAEWLIYTNADIALQPTFYEFVAQELAKGHDALIINRRRIPGHYRSVGQLPQMYAERGLPHPGFDCFVLHRDLIPKFDLGQVCIGIPYIEILMGQNIFCLARNYQLITDAFQTFHIGEEVYKSRHPFLLSANRDSFWKTIATMLPLLDSRRFPYGDRWLLARLWHWGLHPCIPIRLCLRLERRRLFGRE